MPIRVHLFFLAIWAAVTAFAAPSVGKAAAIDAQNFSAAPIGQHISFYKEENGPLTLAQVRVLKADGAFQSRDTPILNFMIGSAPVWLHFSVDNPTNTPLIRQLSIETSWLNRLDISVLHKGVLVAEQTMGDSLPFKARPIDSQFFIFEHTYGPGPSSVFIRVETPDPMVLPMYFVDEAGMEDRKEFRTYSYGFVYGGIFGLLAYNALLFLSLRYARYLLYSLFLASFLVLNMSYTGLGFAWLWPQSTTAQLWGNPTLMQLYVYAGLGFAASFLNTRKTLPRIHKTLLGVCAGLITLGIVLFLLDMYLIYLLLAFVLIMANSVAMFSLGVASVMTGYKPARYFLLASFIALIGMFMTASAVWGFIPYNVWTYRTVEIGVVIDAVLLALALAYQFRLEHEEKIRALQMARIDPLTRINNRRAFHTIARPLWSTAQRNDRSASLILIDIDHFKSINDQYGHALGDKVLMDLAHMLTQSAREGDIVARWGGEEFILFLPETDAQAAVLLAERLRMMAFSMPVTLGDQSCAFSISAGVAEKKDRHRTLEDLIADADIQLYQAKKTGRNRVCPATP